jgi:site-specific recombinase XerD
MYHDDYVIKPSDYKEEMIMQYLLYLTATLGCSREKCRIAAQSIAFYFRHVLKIPYIIPSIIYPRVVTKLPAVMTSVEVKKLLSKVVNVKHRTIIMMLYSSGMRLSEIADLKIVDIDSKQMRIKVVQGKGGKDRYTILSSQVLEELRTYYLQYRPIEYLFNGNKKGKPISVRTIQEVVHQGLLNAGLSKKHYSVHTIRHSFATHLLDNGTDLHTIKELLGHSNIQTTMRYIHLSAKRTRGIANPYDTLMDERTKC